MSLMEQLTESALPEIPEGWKVTAVLEMAAGLPMERLDDIYTWVTGAIEEAKLERIVPVFLYEGTSRLTLVYHEAERRHSYCSRIKSQARRRYMLRVRERRKGAIQFPCLHLYREWSGGTLRKRQRRDHIICSEQQYHQYRAWLL